MRFLMDGGEVLVTRLPYPSDGGHILQLRIACEGPDKNVPASFQRIASSLERNHDGGVMQNDQPDATGYVEVRVLNGLELPEVLSIMANGVRVIQTG